MTVEVTDVRRCVFAKLGLKFFNSRDAIELRTGGHRPNRYVGESSNLLFIPLPFILFAVIYNLRLLLLIKYVSVVFYVFIFRFFRRYERID